MSKIKYTTVTTFIKKYSKFFNQAVKWQAKKSTFKVKNKGTKYISLPPSFGASKFQGTMMDILGSWIINKKIQIDKYDQIPRINKIELVEKIEKLEKDANENKENLKFKYQACIIAAICTTSFRIGTKAETLEKNLKSYLYEKISKKHIITLQKLDTRIRKMLENKKIDDNPIFNIEDLNIAADGDFIIDDENLMDFKSTKENSIQKKHINQLVLYKYLNDKYEKKWDIKFFSIYNPLYDSYWEIDVNEIEVDYRFLDAWKYWNTRKEREPNGPYSNGLSKIHCPSLIKIIEKETFEFFIKLAINEKWETATDDDYEKIKKYIDELFRFVIKINKKISK